MFCPHECPGLYDVYGQAFEELYIKYERFGKARKTIKAQKVWIADLVDAHLQLGIKEDCDPVVPKDLFGWNSLWRGRGVGALHGKGL